MAAVSYNVTTSTSVDEIWRKIQGKLYDGINYTVEEFGWMTEAKDARLAPSTREVLVPVNLTLGGGVASIAEGADEGVPGTPAANEISLALIQFNKRFTISELVRIIDQYAGADATQIESQLKFSARHMLHSMAAGIGDYWWGKSTAVLALTDTDLTSGTVTVTLKAGYGESWITDPAFMARKFAAGDAGVGDRVAFLVGGTLQTNCVGRVSARSTSGGTITVIFDVAPNITTNDLQIVKANSIENTANDYNRGLVGMLDVLLSSSVHGLSDSTNANWSVAYSDTTGGRLNAPRIQNMRDEIANYGPGEADMLVVADGVKRDLMAQYGTQLRFTTDLNLPVDGNVKVKGLDIKNTRRVPPGLAVMWRGQDYQRFFGQPSVDAQAKGMSWGELKKMENKSGYLSSANFVGNNVCKARKSFAYAYGLTQS